MDLNGSTIDRERRQQQHIKRPVSMSRQVNLNYNTSHNHYNPFSLYHNWPTYTNSNNINQAKTNYMSLMSIDKNNRPQLSINYRPVSNTNLIISNYLENQQQTKHKYFVPQADRPSVFGLNIIQSNLQNKSSEILTSTRTAPNENFILNNGFLKPKAIPTSASVNSNFSKSEYFNGSSSSISTQKSNLIKSRLKSSNKTLQNTSGTSVTNLTSEENNIDKLLGSKKARDAFFERLRVTEYFNQTKNVTELSKPTTKTVRSGSGSSKSSDAKTKFYDLKKISFMSHTENHLDTDSLSNSSISGNAINHLNNPNLQVSSTMSLFSKPYSLKTNFSNVTLIDKQFKKAEISVDHAYFYQNSKTNISYQNIKENTHNHNEPGKISLSSIETDKASKNESSYSDPLSQNSRESENSRENKNSRMPNRIKESPVGNMQPSSHRERIDNLLIRRNITTNPVSHTLKLDAEYDTKNRVIQIKTVENKNESPIISTKGTDVNDTNTTTLEVKLVETAQVNERESATTSASSMSSSYSVNGFSSSKNSNSNLNEKSKISASFDNLIVSKQEDSPNRNKILVQTQKFLSQNILVEAKKFLAGKISINKSRTASAAASLTG